MCEGFAPSPLPPPVIPAKAGIQLLLSKCWVPAFAGTTPSVLFVHRFNFQTADAKARVIARILCGAGYAVTFAPSLRPSYAPQAEPEGMERRAAQPLAFRLAAGRVLRSTRSPLGAPCAAFLSPGPRFLVYGPVRRASAAPLCGKATLRRTDDHWSIPSPANSSRSARSGARSGPEASRVRGYEPRPQAPHPLPPSFASHENALGWRG
jgi:hypothetical protein